MYKNKSLYTRLKIFEFRCGKVKVLSDALPEEGIRATMIELHLQALSLNCTSLAIFDQMHANEEILWNFEYEIRIFKLWNIVGVLYDIKKNYSNKPAKYRNLQIDSILKEKTLCHRSESNEQIFL